MSDPITLRLWLSGPLQSWGTHSRFESRATELWPSKSGVIGLLCSATGRTRDESVDDLAAMRFGVRVERRGMVLRDFHTVGAGTDPVAVASGAKGRGIVTERYYLADAVFVIGLEGVDALLLRELQEAAIAPARPIALGRRSCPPAGPIADRDSLYAGDLRAALLADWRPAGARSGSHGEKRQIELVVEDPDGELLLHDQPVGAAFGTRAFRSRRARFIPDGGAVP